MTIKILSLRVHDIRYKTASFIGDALHTDPDYSAAYVVLQTSEPSLEGHGLTFTLGRGTEVIVTAIKSLQSLVVGQTLSDITTNFGTFWKGLVCESQLRWLGPEKGVIHLATAAIVNALWDLWAKSVKKPLWKLLVDLSPEELVSTIDFRYLNNYLTPEEAISILKKKRESAQEREKYLLQHGYPAYNTSVGWLGIDDSTIGDRCKGALASGFSTFKLKVGLNLEQDKRRLQLVREAIGYGPEVKIMVDANQKWEAQEAIDYMKQLKDFKPQWIEEPTSPDDILGHLAVRNGLKEVGVGVATGEHCHNRVIFKQLLQTQAVDVVQPDATRLGGINEVLAVILMAAKSEYVEGGVPVCLHAGGIGLCELNQHLCYFDFVSVSGKLEGRVMEYVDHLHEHFFDPVKINQNGRYIPPTLPGASIEMKPISVENATFRYPSV